MVALLCVLARLCDIKISFVEVIREHIGNITFGLRAHVVSIFVQITVTEILVFVKNFRNSHVVFRVVVQFIMVNASCAIFTAFRLTCAVFAPVLCTSKELHKHCLLCLIDAEFLIWVAAFYAMIIVCGTNRLSNGAKVRVLVVIWFVIVVEFVVLCLFALDIIKLVF